MNKDIINKNSNGELHGEYELYYKNGQLYVKTTYSNGKKHGECKWYYPNGQLSIKQTCYNGELHGEYETYHPDGSLQSRVNYDMGIKIGIEEINFRWRKV